MTVMIWTTIFLEHISLASGEIQVPINNTTRTLSLYSLWLANHEYFNPFPFSLQVFYFPGCNNVSNSGVPHVSDRTITFPVSMLPSLMYHMKHF